MGSAPAETATLPQFDVVVLCAEEYQPELVEFRGDVIYAGFDDSHRGISQREKRIARAAAMQVVRAHRAGRRVLITCWQGRNRSGLVTGLALKMMTRWPTARIVQKIREARGDDALSNASFVRYLTRARVG